MLRCERELDKASRPLLAYAVAIKKQLGIFYDKFHVLIYFFPKEGALLQSYDLENILQA